jgi:hypothetical protein
MPIVGAHMLFYTPEADALRAVLRDAVGWPFVEHAESAPGWLIFKLPPAELAVHPSDGATGHELYLMCDDLDSTMQELQAKGVEFVGDLTEERWGRLSRFRLPGGGEVGMYEPRHPLAIDV